MLVFATNGAPIKASKKISFYDGEKRIVFGLKGIVYTGDFHYIARVCVNKAVWLHDGMVSGKTCKYEDKLSEFTDSDISTVDVMEKHHPLSFIYSQK